MVENVLNKHSPIKKKHIRSNKGKFRNKNLHIHNNYIT